MYMHQQRPVESGIRISRPGSPSKFRFERADQLEKIQLEFKHWHGILERGIEEILILEKVA